ncbi:MAG TPA: DUF6134 family protein [Methylovirgula sp.]|nr:DUF6134 family protein [Methylovirgula sp.]
MPAATQRIFDITRNGTKIGTDIIDIEKRGDTTTVKINNEISVVVMFFVAYHLEAKATETWKKGHFVSFQSSTDDNGKKYDLSATAADHSVVMTVDGRRSTLPEPIIPATMWNKSFLTATKLFDPGKGTVLSVKVRDLGEETIEIHGASLRAHHYKITGDMTRDIWFKGDVPVRVAFSGPDGSVIASDIRDLAVE